MLALIFVLIAARPEVMIQVGPGEQLKDSSLSPDGSLAVSIGHDVGVKLWDVRNARLLRIMLGTDNVPSGVRFLSDGKHVVAWTINKLVVFDASTGQVVGTLDEGINDLAISPGGTQMANTSSKGIKVFSLPDCKPAYAIEGAGYSAPAFSGDGKELAAIPYGEPSKVRWFDAANGTQRGEVVPGGRVFRLGYTATGLFMGTDDTATRAFDRNGKVAWQSNTSLFLRSTPRSDYTIACHRTDGVFVFDTSTGQRRTKLWNNVNPACYGDTSPSADKQSWIRVDPYGGAYVGSTRDASEPRRLTQEGSAVMEVAVSKDTKTLASVYADGTVRLWDAGTAQLKEVVSVNSKGVTSVGFSADGKTLAVGTKSGELVLYTLQPLRETTRVGVCDREVKLRWQGNAVFLACTTTHQDKGSHLYVWRDNKLTEFAHLDGPAVAMRVSLAGDIVYARTPGDLQAVSVKDGKVLWKNSLGYGMSLDLSPDGKKILATRSDTNLAFVDVKTGEPDKAPCRVGRESMNSVAYTADGSQLILGGGGPFYNVYRVTAKTCITVGELKGHRTLPHTVLPVGDKLIVSASRNDLTMRLWNVQENKEAVQMLAITGGGYVSATPDGFYASSKEATRAITFSLGLRSYNYDLFDLRLNRPDIVAERIGIADKSLIEVYRAAVDKRLAKAGFKRDSFGEDFAVPDVAVKELSSSATQVELEVKASDAKSPLDRLLVLVNGVPLTTRGVSLGRANSATQKVLVPLGGGRNSVQVSALNAAGVESERLTLDKAGTSSGRGKLWVIAIGVSKYKQAEYNLDYAAKDATDMAAFFGSAKDRFESVASFVVTDAEATREHIQKLKTELLQSKVDDSVVLFVAGHGLLDSKLDYYFATHDVAFDKPADKGLAWNDLEELLDGIPARRRLLLIDACHSGEVEKDEMVAMKAGEGARGVKARGIKRTVAAKLGAGGKPTSVIMQELFVDLRHGSGANVLSSATGAQYAYEAQEWSNGVFTFALLEALKLRRADANQDSKVSLEELRTYVPPRVGALTGGRQTPTARALNPLMEMGL